MYKLLFSFTKNSDDAIFKVLYSKLYLLSPVLLSDSKVPRELWNGLSKAVPGKFHGPVGHSKRHCAKTEPIFTGLSHGKLSKFFTWIYHTDANYRIPLFSYITLDLYVIVLHIISYHIISYHIISYHIISYQYHIISYHIISYITSYHMPCHVMSCHVM